MEEDQELRFVCKLCNKKYPCGKSLGGHMRSHVVANTAESEEKVESNMKKLSSLGQQCTLNESKVVEFGNGQFSYVLRENPRKTWRAVDSSFPLPQDKICKQCGKAFQSLKALCGHMASHSERDKGFKDDNSSWTSESQKVVMDSHSDTEAEDQILRTRSSKSKRYKKVFVKSPSFTLANNGSSSVSEIDGDEQEEVAMCLMMLSRDSYKGGVNSVVESSDNNSVILETKSSSIDMRFGKREVVKDVHNQEEIIPKMNKIEDLKLKDSVLDAQMENSDSGYFLDECAKAESDVSVDGFRRNSAFNEYNKPLINEYGAEFRQSLNRSKNKYDNGKIESRKRKYISEDPESCNEYGRTTRNDRPNAEVCNISQKRSKYECFNCKRIFKSYQALGGHRPCHKRSSAYYESRYDSGDNSADDSTEFVTTSKKKSTAKNSSPEKKIKAKKHVCPFCDRVFKNGQALGGHKRSHFMGGHEEINNQRPAKKPDLLDLNLPAPEQDQDYGNEW
ncbi:hypothetical protein CDL12_05354 [Handroanthus impetiginosus]|uniref:C2H2-type domain-containing protein n=1 Tax=Handroanthus impetiginosus TaxID=429701 RepID=A0A2G9HWQ1_9LAMI|nr:hypothetical protein CDL12_05354 [Handroanthus impetiginosus]